MPVFPEDRFVDAVVQTIKANEAYVRHTAQVQHFICVRTCSTTVIGVKPADEYQFRILTTPVGCISKRRHKTDHDPCYRF